MTSGFFITVEGPDGAGKSTHISQLVSLFEELGAEVILSREPGGTPVGERIRELLLDASIEDMDPMAELMLYAASRAQHVAGLIRPALEAGKVVICDRFIDSSVAYQGVARGLGVHNVMDVNRLATGGLVPQLTIFIMPDPEVAYQRLIARGHELDRLEKENFDFHSKVYQGYLDIARREPERVIMIDASGDIEETAALVRSEVLRRIMPQ